MISVFGQDKISLVNIKEMIKYFLCFIIICIIYYIYTRYKKKETFSQVTDFDEVLDNKCSILTKDKLNDYNFNLGNCQNSSCPLETCYELLPDVDVNKSVPTFKYHTKIIEKEKQMNEDLSFTCSTNHNPINKLFCDNEATPVCNDLYQERTCYQFVNPDTLNPDTYPKTWMPFVYTKTINSDGECLWINKHNNDDTKTDGEMIDCLDKPSHNCDKRKVICSEYNPNTPFYDNYQYYKVDPYGNGTTCIEDPDRSCYDECNVGETQLLYNFDSTKRRFYPEYFTKQVKQFMNSEGKNTNVCLFLNKENKCIPEKNKYGDGFYIDGWHGDSENAAQYCTNIAGYANSNNLFTNNLKCYEKEPKYCDDLNERDELVKIKYIPTVNNHNPTKCIYTNFQKSQDIIDDPFVCPVYRACKDLNKFRNIDKGYCTNCPEGTYIDPRDNSRYAFEDSTACTPVQQCSSNIDKCYIPYKDFNGEYINNVLIEEDFPQTFNPDKPWECMETFQGLCMKCENPVENIVDIGDNKILKQKYCSFCENDNIDDQIYDLNLKTKRCEKVYNCNPPTDIEQDSQYSSSPNKYVKCFDENYYTINNYEYSNLDDKFTECVYHKIYPDSVNELSTVDFIKDCPQPAECPNNSFIDYIKRNWECPNSNCSDEVKKICKNGYVEYNTSGDKIEVGCERCELPQCIVNTEINVVYKNGFIPPDNDMKYDSTTIYNILNHCHSEDESTICSYTNTADPFNKEPYCRIDTATKTIKFESETDSKRCYYNKQIEDTLEEDTKKILTGQEYGIYEVNKIIKEKELKNEVGDVCPVDCSFGPNEPTYHYYGSEPTNTPTNISEHPIYIRRYDGRNYIRDDRCSDHETPKKIGQEIVQFNTIKKKGKYGEECDVYLENNMNTSSQDLFSYSSRSSDDCSSSSVKIHCKDSGKCFLNRLQSYTDTEDWQITKPYTLPCCKIDQTCEYECENDCVSTIGNVCRKYRECHLMKNLITDKAWGNGSLCGLPENSSEICERDESSCPTCSDNPTTYRIIDNFGDNKPTLFDDDWTVVPDEISDENIIRNSYAYCTHDGNVKKLYKIKKYNEQHGICWDDTLSVTRNVNEIYPINGNGDHISTCDYTKFCVNKPILIDKTPVYSDRDIIVKRNYNLKQEYRKCCRNTGYCIYEKGGVSKYQTQTDYQDQLCDLFSNKKIIKNKTLHPQCVDNDDLINNTEDDIKIKENITANYTHIVVNRNTEDIYYYKLEDYTIPRNDDSLFTSEDGYDTYIIMIGTTNGGIDCSLDIYYNDNDVDCTCAEGTSQGTKEQSINRNAFKDASMSTNCPQTRTIACNCRPAPPPATPPPVIPAPVIPAPVIPAPATPVGEDLETGPEPEAEPEPETIICTITDYDTSRSLCDEKCGDTNNANRQMYGKKPSQTSQTCSDDPNIIEYCPTDQQYPDCIKICPKNKWISKPNGKDYYFPTQPASYDDAVAYCLNLDNNSKLISINNSYDRYIVNHMIEDCGAFEWSSWPSPATAFSVPIYAHIWTSQPKYYSVFEYVEYQPTNSNLYDLHIMPDYDYYNIHKYNTHPINSFVASSRIADNLRNITISDLEPNVYRMYDYKNSFIHSDKISQNTLPFICEKDSDPAITVPPDDKNNYNEYYEYNTKMYLDSDSNSWDQLIVGSLLYEKYVEIRTMDGKDGNLLKTNRPFFLKGTKIEINDNNDVEFFINLNKTVSSASEEIEIHWMLYKKNDRIYPQYLFNPAYIAYRQKYGVNYLSIFENDFNFLEKDFFECSPLNGQLLYTVSLENVNTIYVSGDYNGQKIKLPMNFRCNEGYSTDDKLTEERDDTKIEKGTYSNRSEQIIINEDTDQNFILGESPIHRFSSDYFEAFQEYELAFYAKSADDNSGYSNRYLINFVYKPKQFSNIKTFKVNNNVHNGRKIQWYNYENNNTIYEVNSFIRLTDETSVTVEPDHRILLTFRLNHTRDFLESRRINPHYDLYWIYYTKNDLDEYIKNNNNNQYKFFRKLGTPFVSQYGNWGGNLPIKTGSGPPKEVYTEHTRLAIQDYVDNSESSQFTFPENTTKGKYLKINEVDPYRYNLRGLLGDRLAMLHYISPTVYPNVEFLTPDTEYELLFFIRVNGTTSLSHGTEYRYTLVNQIRFHTAAPL